MIGKFWKLFLNKIIHNSLIYSGPKHILVVVKWHEAFNKLAEHVKRFFFIKDLQKSSNYKVKALAIPNSYIPDTIRTADALYTLQSFLANVCQFIEVQLIGKCSRQIELDLVRILARVSLIKLFGKLN
jgi:hypothetical protein